MRLYTPLIFLVAFVGWFLYRAFIKKDFRQHTNDFVGGLVFFGIWGLIYWWFFYL